MQFRRSSSSSATRHQSRVLGIGTGVIVWLALPVLAFRFVHPLLGLLLLLPAAGLVAAGLLAPRMIRRSLLAGTETVPVPEPLGRRLTEVAGNRMEMVLLDRPEPLAFALDGSCYVSLGLLGAVDEPECRALLHRLSLSLEHGEARRRGWARALEQGPLLFLAFLGASSEQGGIRSRLAVPWGAPVAQLVEAGPLEQRLDDAMGDQVGALSSCLRLASLQPPVGSAGAAVGLGPLAPAQGGGGRSAYRAAMLARIARLDALAGNRRHVRGPSAWQRLVTERADETELGEELQLERDAKGRPLLGAPPASGLEPDPEPAISPVEVDLDLLILDAPPALWEAVPDPALDAVADEDPVEPEPQGPGVTEDGPGAVPAPPSRLRRFARDWLNPRRPAQSDPDAREPEGLIEVAPPQPQSAPSPPIASAAPDHDPDQDPDWVGAADPAPEPEAAFFGADVEGETLLEDAAPDPQTEGIPRMGRRWWARRRTNADEVPVGEEGLPEISPSADSRPDAQAETAEADSSPEAPAEAGSRRRWWRRPAQAPAADDAPDASATPPPDPAMEPDADWDGEPVVAEHEPATSVWDPPAPATDESEGREAFDGIPMGVPLSGPAPDPESPVDLDDEALPPADGQEPEDETRARRWWWPFARSPQLTPSGDGDDPEPDPVTEVLVLEAPEAEQDEPNVTPSRRRGWMRFGRTEDPTAEPPARDDDPEDEPEAGSRGGDDEDGDDPTLASEWTDGGDARETTRSQDHPAMPGAEADAALDPGESPPSLWDDLEPPADDVREHEPSSSEPQPPRRLRDPIGDRLRRRA